MYPDFWTPEDVALTFVKSRLPPQQFARTLMNSLAYGIPGHMEQNAVTPSVPNSSLSFLSMYYITLKLNTEHVNVNKFMSFQYFLSILNSRLYFRKRDRHLDLTTPGANPRIYVYHPYLTYSTSDNIKDGHSMR